ncbi:MAG: hypothetical protein GF346_08735, partial [Candidatus Eisenbacteria bacterium]|nr:hypothetical protein [Candidatus Latescibacterota bacterium]MBD3302521.1 hypothetical protein [Candidatus Eisenbacteria bacterium]
MAPSPHDTAALFEEASSWDPYRGNPYLEQRTRIVRALLPEGVETLLDVGCGNGILVHALSDRYRTIGLD